MIQREIKRYSWDRSLLTLDEFGQSVFNETPLGTIDAAIYFDTQILIQNPLYVDATHVGLTREKSVILGDRISMKDTVYHVIAANPAGRYTQLILKLV